MSTAIITCCCSTIGAPNGIRLCEEHHRYWNGDKRLASASSVIRETWPIKPDFSKADHAVIENARDRGIAVDSLFSAYVIGGLDRIPAGTRQDAVNLFMKAKKWFDAKGQSARSQVLLADSEIAGTCDVIIGNGFIFDVKCTYSLEAVYPLQVAGYADLYETMTKMECSGIGILHLSERFPEARWVPLDLEQCRRDWRTLRATWSMVRRLSPKEALKEIAR